MIDISERITRMTTNSDAAAPLVTVGASGSHVLHGARASTGTRVTLEFSRSVPLSPGQIVRLRYELAGGSVRECIGVAQLTHTVANRGQLVVFHYRLSHWIRASTIARIREIQP